MLNFSFYLFLKSFQLYGYYYLKGPRSPRSEVIFMTLLHIFGFKSDIIEYHNQIKNC